MAELREYAKNYNTIAYLAHILMRFIQAAETTMKSGYLYITRVVTSASKCRVTTVENAGITSAHMRQTLQNCPPQSNALVLMHNVSIT